MSEGGAEVGANLKLSHILKNMAAVLKSKQRNFSDVCGHVNKNFVQKMKLFFPVKANILLFLNMKLSRLPGGFSDIYFSLKFLIFAKNTKLQNLQTKI